VSSAHNILLLQVEVITVYHIGQTRRYNQNFHENEGVCLATVDYIELGCWHVKNYAYSTVHWTACHGKVHWKFKDCVTVQQKEIQCLSCMYL